MMNVQPPPPPSSFTLRIDEFRAIFRKRRPIHPNATMTDQGHREAIRPVGDTFNVDPHGPSSFSPRPNHRNMPPTMPQRLPTQEDFASQARQGLTVDNMQRHSHQSPSSQQNFVW